MKSMMKSLWATSAALLTLGTTAQAQVLPRFVAPLSGSQEVPPVASPGTGDVSVLVNQGANTMDIDVSFAGLSSPTTIAHIHCCTVPTAPPATTVPTLAGFPVGVTSGSYDQTFDLTQASTYNPAFITTFGGGTVAGAQAALVGGLLNGAAYFNIHTNAFPGGEIRGNLVPIPEPGTYLLLGGGLLVGWLARRRLR